MSIVTPPITGESPETAPPSAEDFAFQQEVLQQVSRTFALTIPQLPEELRVVVGNAYLLCRIADTIEDCEVLAFSEQQRFYKWFIAAAEGTASPEEFAAALHEQLGEDMLPAERELVRRTPAVLRITRSFHGDDQAALTRCIRIMSEGMEHFQARQAGAGLRDQRELDSYCYYVAGVVGEMLTELFCNHSEAAAQRREALSELAVSFGQGLQMTNIIKDVWHDKERRVCWLPADAFGGDLEALAEGKMDERFEAVLRELTATARGHLENALRYTLLIPASETGIRQFCLWALGMAVLTLRKIHRSRSYFSEGATVKISRNSVRATIAVSKVFGRSDRSLRVIFRLLTAALPKSPPPRADQS
ncbi:MAG: phytoene/squalene synthase family protein [Candidatus Hydrogenedentota bacterium]